MSDKQYDSNQRDSVRCRVLGSRQHCTLKIGSSVQPAKMLDESAGGFAILVDRLDGIAVNQNAELHTPAGSYLVCITRVTEVALPRDQSDAKNQFTFRFRLGLSRLGEAVPLAQARVSWWAWGRHFSLTQGNSSFSTLAIVGVFLATVAMVVLLRLMGGPWFPKSLLIQPASFSKESVSPQKMPPGVSSPSARSATKAAPPIPPELLETIRRLPGAAVLTLPEIVERLQLTDEQQQKIRQLIEASTNAIRIIDQDLSGEQRWQITELRKQLLDKARREAIEYLTPQQRDLWEKLAASQPAEK